MQDVIKKLECFLSDNEISASALARALGLSPATISQFRKAEYKGDIATVAKKIENYIDNYSQKKQKVVALSEEVYQSDDFVTANFVIDEAVAEKEIALIYGEAGSGKTTVLKEFCKKHSNAVLIEATCHTSAKAILEDLCEALKIDAPNGLNARLKAVARFLKQSDKILVVDEAEHLPLRALEDLRRIHDFSRTPLILCGTEILLKNLMGKNKELKQLYSRICGKWLMRGLSKQECNDFFGSFIYEWSKGNFRSSSKLYKKAKRLAEFNKTSINAEIVARASSMVVLG
ncbi:AAA family ATPase [Campylobacter pinnipediorum]|uniref:AAA family ATPase n=1 Tax=Campylobacter pinnipediorum TaxID=1965231 RepID=UPI00084D9CF0|nr:AAA family ATPase [Campylobacter pinnipediorum]AQW80768.1 ATPase, AAA family, possible transposase [Campylobacter pinnipediorum subsp. pinnipediorum]AQW83346.1 ATPase, AAA family, possible transposase [Campylobacter pinnipediorum subsp. pinnipediorum]OPA75411.1 bacteriocin [Campylobacter pinnipediorum subsp. pinnipediorum]